MKQASHAGDSCQDAFGQRQTLRPRVTSARGTAGVAGWASLFISFGSDGGSWYSEAHG
jgi:hypothetical protein